MPTAIAAHFAIPSPIGRIEPLGRGLINDTFRLESAGRHYVLQRINGAVFPRPARIMANLQVLQDHLAEQEPPIPRLPALIPTAAGNPCLEDEDGGCWRLQEFIQDAVTLERIADLDQAHQVGAILGCFHRATAALPVGRLGVSLPGFHDTPAYLRTLLRRLDRAPTPDPGLLDCLDFVMSRIALVEVLDRARRSGAIPLRVTHGDPKLDNILFARDTGRALALIDLDTVQPGLLLHDIGDCLRSCCNRGGEQSDAPSGAGFDLDICDGILGGYVASNPDLLCQAEIALIYEGIRLLPFELGLRFLADHLDGDRYFRVTRQGDNLRKAHVQFALVADIEHQAESIERLVRRHFGSPDRAPGHRQSD